MCACLVLKTNRHTVFAVPLQLAHFAPTSTGITGPPIRLLSPPQGRFRRMARQRLILRHRAGLPPPPARFPMLWQALFCFTACMQLRIVYRERRGLSSFSGKFKGLGNNIGNKRVNRLRRGVRCAMIHAAAGRILSGSNKRERHN